MTWKPKQRELRNGSGEVPRALGGGEGRRRQFVPTKQVVAAFKDIPSIDYAQFRADIDRYVDQDPTPRF